MNTKHTPSPWRLSTTNPHAVNADSKDLTIGIATTHGTDDANYSDFFPSTEEAKANARLIAAAPELLEALNYARDIVARAASVEACKWTTDLDKITKHVRNTTAQIDAAIAKATGETAKAPIKLSGYIRRAKEQNND